MTAKFSYKELNLLLFALTGGPAAFDPAAVDSSCETACPILESTAQLPEGGPVSGKERLTRHLNNHLREGLIQCGMFEHLAACSVESTVQADLDLVNRKLGSWWCEINLEAPERTLLKQSLSGLPSSAWISMPVSLWRLRRKLRDRPA